PPSAPVPAPPTAAPAFRPVVDPGRELKGAALIEALKSGGYVLFLRHTETGNVTAECNVSNLSAKGEQDAKALGGYLKRAGVPIGPVWSSPLCRIQDTARLLDVGPFTVTEDLTNRPVDPKFDLPAARAKRIATAPPAGRNTLLVSHMQGGNHESQYLQLMMGEMIVFRPEGGGATPVARIRLEDWERLLAAAGK
ncbi:MAG TPA: histidine phosphatase family protein, partial [Usitatibacteraceae bacterium]|nr:histidine phosphatase family protein [Usitatibacteraceae bacterium]